MAFYFREFDENVMLGPRIDGVDQSCLRLDEQHNVIVRWKTGERIFTIDELQALDGEYFQLAERKFGFLRTGPSDEQVFAHWMLRTNALSECATVADLWHRKFIYELNRLGTRLLSYGCFTQEEREIYREVGRLVRKSLHHEQYEVEPFTPAHAHLWESTYELVSKRLENFVPAPSPYPKSVATLQQQIDRWLVGS